jgi:hypothetical protein
MKIIITESQRDSILGYRGLTAFMGQAKDSYHTFAKVLERLANQPGNPYTDYSDIDENLKMKYFSPDPRGVEVYIDIDDLGESEEPFMRIHKYGHYDDDDAELYETHDNKQKYWKEYIDENGNKQRSYKSIIEERLYNLRKMLGITDLSLHIYP